MTCLSSASHSVDRLPPFTGGWRGAADRRWHPVELTAMIVGFVIFWPIGLAVLAWKKWMGPLPREGRLPFGRHRDRFAPATAATPPSTTTRRPSSPGSSASGCGCSRSRWLSRPISTG